MIVDGRLGEIRTQTRHGISAIAAVLNSDMKTAHQKRQRWPENDGSTLVIHGGIDAKGRQRIGIRSSNLVKCRSRYSIAIHRHDSHGSISVAAVPHWTSISRYFRKCLASFEPLGGFINTIGVSNGTSFFVSFRKALGEASTLLYGWLDGPVAQQDRAPDS